MATLSLCMIVRDSERSLRYSLESARPFVDEMIVVDTGSRDQTVELAQALGARVFHFPWCDDFSAARNFSFAQATSDWIFWMDADDQLPPESGREMRWQIGQHARPDAAYLVTVEEETRTREGLTRREGSAQVRLVPRHPEIRFCYRIHEQLSPALSRLNIPILPSRITVHHVHADRTPAGEVRRSERNLRLLLLDHAEHPGDPYILFNLGLAYLSGGDAARAIAYLNQSLPGFSPNSTTLLNAYIYLAIAYGSARDYEGQIRSLLTALKRFPDNVSLLRRLGDAYLQLGDLRHAADYYSRALMFGRLEPTVYHISNPHGLAAARLGNVYERMGMPGQTEQLWINYLRQQPRDLLIRQVLIEFYIQQQRADDAARHIQELPENHPQAATTRLALGGCVHVLRQNYYQARLDLQMAYDQGYRSLLPLHGLAIVMLMQHDFVAAEPVLLEMLRIDPRHPHALSNLALVYENT